MKSSRSPILALIACLLSAFLTGCGSVPMGRVPEAAARQLTIVHVNDTHGHEMPFQTAQEGLHGGYARLAAVIKEVRGRSDSVLLLHGGDSVVGSPTRYLKGLRPDYEQIPTYGWRGIESIETMNLLGFDAMVIGNHELDYGRRWLEGLMARAEFPVLSANVIRRDVPDLDGLKDQPLAKPYVILERGGLRVGILGLTTVDYDMSLQVRFADPTPFAERLVPELEKQCDLVVVLSHMGYKQDKELARAVPGIDVIVGGHTHTLLPDPVVVDGTLIVQAGQHTENVGILDLTVAGGKVRSHSYEMRPLGSSAPEDPDTDAALRRWLSVGSVGPARLEGGADRPSGLSSLATAAMLAATKADAALIGASSLTGGLGPGEPSLERFFEVFWPYHRRGLPPEKDLDERQQLSVQDSSAYAPVRVVARASDGLRTLVVARVPAAEFSRWLRVNEGRLGSADYVQADLRGPEDAAAAASGGTTTLVLPFDLALRLSGLGLELPPQGMEVKGIELFEAVFSYLGTPRS